MSKPLSPSVALFLVNLGNSGSVDEVMVSFAEVKIFIYNPARIFPLGRLIQRDLTLKRVPWKELVTLANVSFTTSTAIKVSNHTSRISPGFARRLLVGPRI